MNSVRFSYTVYNNKLKFSDHKQLSEWGSCFSYFFAMQQLQSNRETPYVQT